MFKIEKNIPLPSALTARRTKRKSHGGLTGTMRRLKVGESFFYAMPEGADMLRFQGKITSTGAALRKRENSAPRFAVRSVQEDGKRGCRVWRVEDRVKMAPVEIEVPPASLRNAAATIREFSEGVCV